MSFAMFCIGRDRSPPGRTPTRQTEVSNRKKGSLGVLGKEMRGALFPEEFGYVWIALQKLCGPCFVSSFFLRDSCPICHRVCILVGLDIILSFSASSSIYALQPTKLSLPDSSLLYSVLLFVLLSSLFWPALFVLFSLLYSSILLCTLL